MAKCRRMRGRKMHTNGPAWGRETLLLSNPEYPPAKTASRRLSGEGEPAT
jgi:hypothetical protein